MLAIDLIQFLETSLFFSVDFGSKGKQTANNIFKELSNLLPLMICLSECNRFLWMRDTYL